VSLRKNNIKGTKLWKWEPTINRRQNYRNFRYGRRVFQNIWPHDVQRNPVTV